MRPSGSVVENGQDLILFPPPSNSGFGIRQA
jgi:hypothetical protein